MCSSDLRFLLSRVKGYDIDQHLVGAGYLFVRGMIGLDTPSVDDRRNGVFVWRPATETILEVNSILGGAS